jgi:DNA-binding NtrC family response regulator
MEKKDLRLLVVDDEEAARYGIRRALEAFGQPIAEAESAEAARALMRDRKFDLVLLDVNLPGISGLEFLNELQGETESSKAEAPLVIIITAHGSERLAVQAVKSGAYDYIAKPFELDDLRLVVKNAFETIKLRQENRSLRRRIEIETSQRGALLGNSEAMQSVRGMIDKVADTDATVLVRGESGTGKELVARELHDRSSARSGGAFVAVNCAALPTELIESELFGHEKGAFTGAAARRRGKFEQANGGTLFLDEIGDMSANVQAKLLRALEERRIERLGGDESIPVDVRIISATHRALEEEIADGNFRADLFYRLRVVTIDIAPLRERREDIPVLAEAFARQAAERHRLPERPIGRDALKKLIEYDWPGNVRELRNAIERAAIMSEGPELNALDLSEEAAPRTPIGAIEVASNGNLLVPYTSDFRDDRKEFERRYIARCLEESGGNVTKAASVLGMHRQSLQHKLRELGLGRRYVAVGADKERQE